MNEAIHIFIRLSDQLISDERQQVIALCTRAYGENFAHLFESLPNSTHVIAEINGQFVSHACWVTRWLQPDGLPLLRTAYVEAVATHQRYQRGGLATRVLQTLHAQIADFDLGGLSPNPAVARWYRRMGWEDWAGPLALRMDGGGLVPTPGYEVMILRLPSTPPLDPAAQLTAEWRAVDLW